ncbi:hypothetical protein D3C81_1612350 [compost metagenome]
MRIDFQVWRFVVMPGHMQAHHTLGRYARKERRSVIAMVASVDDQVVDIQQQVAVSLIQHRTQEVDLAHRLVRRRVIGDVFHRDAPPQGVLYLTDAPGDMAHGLVSERHGDQIIQMTIIGAVAEVLAKQRYSVPVEKRADTL